MIAKYLSLVKFSHTIFALPFALIGFLLAIHFTDAGFDVSTLIKVVLCMVFARSAAMAYNRYADHTIDLQNPRTAIREIPAGIISPRSAMAFVVINSVLFSATTSFINPLCFALSPVALLVILGYSLTKRWTFLCHLVLGIGLSLAPIGAYLAVTGTFNFLPLLFSAMVFTWVSGFDIIYALQDEDFDRSLQLRSIPVRLGKNGALRFARVMHLLTTLAMVAAGYFGELGTWYWIGASSFAGLLIYQHILVRPNDLSKINLAFFTTNGVASVIFATFVGLDLFY